MLISKKLRWVPLALARWPVGLALMAYAAFFVVIHDDVPSDLRLPVAVPAILGTAISIILGFRTGAAYERWWEARRIWGAIVNDSRTLARQVLTLFRPPEDDAGQREMRTLQTEIVYRQIGWNYALSRTLRRQDPLPALDAFVSHDELVTLQKKDNRPHAMLQRQAESVRQARERGWLDSILSLPLEDTLRRFSDHMGGCERIKNTTFPTAYSFIVSRSILLFFLFLPPALVVFLDWWTVPFSMLVAWIFVLLETISERLQDPFENTESDTPMTAISRTIEINLREQLGETNLPPRIEPVDGVLM